MTREDLAIDILDFREAIRMSEDTVSEILGIPYDLYVMMEEGSPYISIETYLETFSMMEEEFSHILHSEGLK